MINIRNFHKKFNAGTINEVYALKGIDLDIAQGDWVTIIGTNGSGKSTLLNAISGSFIGDEGSVFIADEDVTFLHDYQRSKLIARVFQNPFMGTSPNMTIAENLHLANMRGKKRSLKIGFTSSQKKYYRELIASLEMQLEDRMDNIIGSLSGGQRQAITLLMAVMTKPKVLLLDEHTAALDPKTANQVIKLTKQFIAEQNLTTIMVTHSMQQALELGNRTVMMNKGVIIDDLSASMKSKMNVSNLLDKFSDIHKAEQLTSEMLEHFRQVYI